MPAKTPATTKEPPPRSGEAPVPVSGLSLEHVENWIFDLDNTLYPADSNLFAVIDQRMKAFISAELGIEADDAFRVQKDYFRKYGTTLRGLMLHHGTNPHAFLDYVHDIDLTMLTPDPELARCLKKLGGRKIIHTNGSGGHARRVLERLGIGEFFTHVFDIIEADFLPKPEPAAYRRLLERFRLCAGTTALFEDIPRNLVAAAEMGMTTIWVRNHTRWAEEAESHDHIHHVTDDLTGWISDLVAARAPQGEAPA
ncbi:MAG: pyrimidine 5'-nucleotidase [Alphaproteobacteria bacterium]|nr:pyrimidine 5'-nucleotidase [Alphaproteobacteria bacterium]